jgi:3-hydroxybutyryl-CoA dehydrogenase
MNIGVIGYGVMGEGIVQYLACSEHVKKIYLKIGKKKKFDKNIFVQKLKLNCRLLKKSFDEEMSNKVLVVENYKDFNECFIVIESIIENLKIKSDTLVDLSEELNSDIIISSNTSSFMLKQLITNVKYPNRFCCTHFFNPLWSTKYVELIINNNFDKEILKDLSKFIELIGKKIIYVKDINGFAVNRILIPMINEAIKLVEDGIISKEDINNIFEKNVGMPMGPLKLSDFIGNDTVLSIIKNLSNESEKEIKISETLKNLVKNNFLGRKTGKGFDNF